MSSNHLILCHPLLLPSIFPSIRVFSNESALCIRWPKYWSFSFKIVLPMNTPDWFPLGTLEFPPTWLYSYTIHAFSYPLCVCVPSCVWCLATPWTVARQIPLSTGFFPARILEWVVISSSGGSFQPRDWTHDLLHLLNWQMDSLPLSHLGR